MYDRLEYLNERRLLAAHEVIATTTKQRNMLRLRIAQSLDPGLCGVSGAGSDSAADQGRAGCALVVGAPGLTVMESYKCAWQALQFHHLGRRP